MTRESAIVASLNRRAKRTAKAVEAVRLGKITAVDAGPPATVTVKGIKMRYADSIATPAVGDVVAYVHGTNFVLARRA